MMSNSPYAKLLTPQFGYQCIFEGLEEPVFFKNLYPVIHRISAEDEELKYTSDQWEERKYIWGLKYKPGLSDDEDGRNENNHELLLEHQQEYIQELLQWFQALNSVDSNKVWGVIAVPSSNKDITNAVTSFAQFCTKKTNNFRDLTGCVYRADSKEAAHDGGTRDRNSNISTLALKDQNLFDGVDNLVVIDDVTTSGNTMGAMKEFLTENGIDLPTYNYVFGRTIDAWAESYYQDWCETAYAGQWNDHSHVAVGKVTGIVYDLDQTLIDSQKRNDEFEHNANYNHIVFKAVKNLTDDEKAAGKESFHSFLQRHKTVYSCYDGVKELQTNGPVFTIVTNSSNTRCRLLLETQELQKSIYPAIWESHFDDKQTDFVKGQYQLYYGTSYAENSHSYFYDFKKMLNVFGAGHDLPKPAPENVEDAIKWLQDNGGQGRIVGLGNTPEDIIAYHEAGIEAALALWGVPEELRDFARQHWGADIAFDNFAEFANWTSDMLMVDAKTTLIKDLQGLEDQVDDQPKETYIYYVVDGNDSYLQKTTRQELKVEEYQRLYTCSSDGIAVLKLLETWLQDSTKPSKGFAQNPQINVYPIGQLFYGQAGWDLLDALSLQTGAKIYFSKKLNQAFQDDKLDSFENNYADTREQNDKCLATLKSWKSLGLPWPGTEKVTKNIFPF